MGLINHIGRFFMLMGQVFRRPEKMKVYVQQFWKEVDNIGINSLGIVAIVSTFMGAVTTIQTAYNMESPWIPDYAVGLAVRDSIILEFAPTIISIILAGKIGSNVASEIGTMRVYEQIDALEIMGVNASSFLILPKIMAALILIPLLVILAMFLGIGGGWLFGVLSGVVTSSKYIYGITYWFIPFYVTYAIIKTFVFAFIITAVPSYFGYYTSGGAVEVGRSSTQAVVYSTIIILLTNLIITQMLLA